MIDIERLRELAGKATPQDFDSAQIKSDDGWIECQACGGEGEFEMIADYCNYDGTALGVQFYGIGDEHVNAEAYYRAANPAAIIELLDRLETAERDAGRYRFLRSVGPRQQNIIARFGLSEMDRVVDEAMNQEPSHEND